jgi:hypothetical protein
MKNLIKSMRKIVICDGVDVGNPATHGAHLEGVELSTY